MPSDSSIALDTGTTTTPDTDDPAILRLRAEIDQILAQPATLPGGAKLIRSEAEETACYQTIGWWLICRANSLGIPGDVAKVEATRGVGLFKARLKAYAEEQVRG